MGFVSYLRPQAPGRMARSLLTTSLKGVRASDAAVDSLSATTSDPPDGTWEANTEIEQENNE